MPYEMSSQVFISRNTEELLLSRIKDDHRVELSYNVLFGDKIRDDIKKSDIKTKKTFVLRKAVPGDTLTYILIPDPETIKLNIEQNLANIAVLKSQKQLNDLKQVWVITYDIAKEDFEKEDGFPNFTIYVDPNAADVNKIIKENRLIYGVFIIIEYNSPETINNPESFRTEWVLMSPADERRLDEYNQFLKDREAKALENLFYIKFGNFIKTTG
jgi:hypothetical protein